MREINVKEGYLLEDYTCYAPLLATIDAFRNETALLKKNLTGRTIWMINSTEQGGGVAEMLPRKVSIMRQIGLNVAWWVIETRAVRPGRRRAANRPDGGEPHAEETFFPFTKKIHNLIHGQGEAHITKEEKQVYRNVNTANAEVLAGMVKPHDVVIIHDPQPAGMISELKKQVDVIAVWRCHIGLDTTNENTRAAWDFLMPYLEEYDHFVFSAPEYIPQGLTGNVTIIHPGIDPFSHKNRPLNIHKLSGILHNAGLVVPEHPAVSPPFAQQVTRLQPDGSFASALLPSDIGLFYRPIITQVSRWDRLKGFELLMRAFAYLKKHIQRFCEKNSRHAASVRQARLVLAGPDPDYVSDDPEGKTVLQNLKELYALLDPSVQEDIAILKLPMHSVKENALIVNALQRCSYVVAQNSLQEGFGLTATEAMWKRVPVLASNACGLRHQIRNNIDGVLIHNPEDEQEVATRLSELLKEPHTVEQMGFQAEIRVINNFLNFSQIGNWLRILNLLAEQRELQPKQ